MIILHLNEANYMGYHNSRTLPIVPLRFTLAVRLLIVVKTLSCFSSQTTLIDHFLKEG